MPFNRPEQSASADAAAPARAPLTVEQKAQVHALHSVRDDLVADAKSWARQLVELVSMSWRAEHSGGSARRELPMELAGSWHISQLTAERWLSEAERFHDALPLSLE